MSNQYITQLIHFLDENGNIPLDIPDEARGLGAFLGSVVAWVTNHVEPEVTNITNCPCIGELHGHHCLTEVMASYHPDSGVINWECPACESNGVITNWELSSYDRRGTNDKN